MKSAIIFGASGQDGYYLNQILKKNQVNSHLVSRKELDIIGDIGDQEFVFSLIKKFKPDYIFHLAATSKVNHEFLEENHHSISKGTINILEGVLKYSKKTKVFITGSAEQFLNENKAISENTSFSPNNSYAVERIYSSYLSRYFRLTFSINVYIGYLFHHDSPFRKENHLNQKILNYVKNFNEDQPQKLILGDYTIKKEFNFAGDIMNAAWILVNQNKVFEAVIGSGKPYEIRKWLSLAFRKKELDWEDWVEVDKDFTAPYRSLYSDPTLIKSIGWKPKVDIENLLNMMY